MAAFGNQHRIGFACLAPQAADIAVRHAVDVNLCIVVYRDYLAQFARLHQLLNLHEVGVKAEHVAYTYDDTLAL